MAAAYFPRSQLGNKGIEPLAFSQTVSALPFELTVPSVGWKQRHSHCHMQCDMIYAPDQARLTYLVQVALEVRLGLGTLIEFRDLQGRSQSMQEQHFDVHTRQRRSQAPCEV